MLLGAAIGCAAAPLEFPLRAPSVESRQGALQEGDYASAVEAILRVTVHKFGLPVPRGKVEIHTTRESFEQALIIYLKITPELARTTSSFAKAAVGSYVLIINKPALTETWPKRVELLAHEIIHLIQLELANRPGITGNQWLIEGHAEWMAFQVTAALDLDNYPQARNRIIENLRELRRTSELPNLLRLHEFADWVATRRATTFDATYSQSLLVVEFLVERHSMAKVVDYFRRFEQSAGAVKNFNAVFGESLNDFGRALDAHFEKLLGIEETQQR